MKGFVAGAERAQASLLPECLEDWIDESNAVRVIDAFVDALDLSDLGFDGVEPEATGRPSYLRAAQDGRTMHQGCLQTEIGKICSNRSLAAHLACRSSSRPPTPRYHTTKTHSGRH